MRTFELDSPEPNRAATWVELTLVYEGKSVSKERLKSQMNDCNGDVADHDVDLVWLELRKREFRYGSKPPFKMTDGTVKSNINWKKFPHYMLCLLLEMYGNTVDPVKTGKLFERISYYAIKRYLGGDAILYGFPENQKLSKIATDMGETFIIEPRPRYKDRGVDVLAWKSWNDRRPSQIVILMQCAAGHNWKDKTTELPVDAWNEYIHWACSPIKAFSIPYIISDETEFHDISKEAGLLLDRTRIYKNTIDVPLEQKLKETTISCCNTMINKNSSRW